MFKVLVSDPISDFGLQQLRNAEDIKVTKLSGLSEEELISIINEYDALLVRSQTKVTRNILKAGINLKVVGCAGVGVDNIDLDGATILGIVVVNAPDGNTVSTCEHTFAMMMALARHVPQANAKTVSGVWDRKSFLGVELQNKTLGVLGLGRIGIEVAKRAAAFGMIVIGHDPFMSEERARKLGIKLTTVDEILRTADFITLHTPLKRESNYMIAKPQFDVMKPGMHIINCYQGGIIDEGDLVNALDEGILAGAAFDVFEKEPPTRDHPFLKHPKIIVTPHLSASTLEAQENVAIDVSKQVINILRNEPFKNAVNMQTISSDHLNRLHPYFTLSEQLGKSLAQMTDGAVRDVTVGCAGDLAELDTSPLIPYVLKGILSHHLGAEHVNIVNATHLAKERDLNFVTQKSLLSQSSSNEIMIRMKTTKEEKSVRGSLLPELGERLVQIGPYPVDIPPSGQVLLISQMDRPGIIGRVGRVLGRSGINIVTMQVGRNKIGNSALMILKIDKKAPKNVIEELYMIPEIRRVREISFD
ncbi:phosphoglycerate dehydrogenase [Siminovitchia terrae]|uniref:D-3-phosphoglycerate dehydrogenase n=1 Tax=Siminovitchia terrae TaxID=1914933 RepID=A0A429XA27_SIMTE|nr:phosphoglycerate dehydrogenase [Siminovitchia terrae]RST59973.1 phosphoglycerate dehydrogenase [Siminovitchia terrae]GIN95989.1 phosphoglycerate dehydrogenase [Siminovitchia terrae]